MQQSHGLFAIAKLLVYQSDDLPDPDSNSDVYSIANICNRSRHEIVWLVITVEQMFE